MTAPLNLVTPLNFMTPLNLMKEPRHMLPIQGKTPEYGAANGAKSGAGRAAPYPPALKPGGYGASRPSRRAGCPEYGAENGAENGAFVTTAAQREAPSNVPALER